MQDWNEYSRVLLIDLDVKLLNALSLFLQHRHFSVATASSADQAAQMLQSIPFDVIIAEKSVLLDDDQALLNIIKTLFRDMKLIIMDEGQVEVEHIYRKGAAGVVSKPGCQDDFVNGINRIVRERRNTHRFMCRQVACRLRTDSDQAVVDTVGILENISLDGALIRSDHPFEAEEVILLDFYSLEQEKKLATVKGHIVRTFDGDDRFPYSHAVRFDQTRHPDILEKMESCIFI